MFSLFFLYSLTVCRYISLRFTRIYTRNIHLKYTEDCSSSSTSFVTSPYIYKCWCMYCMNVCVCMDGWMKKFNIHAFIIVPPPAWGRTSQSVSLWWKNIPLPGVLLSSSPFLYCGIYIYCWFDDGVGSDSGLHIHILYCSTKRTSHTSSTLRFLLLLYACCVYFNRSKSVVEMESSRIYFWMFALCDLCTKSFHKISIRDRL